MARRTRLRNALVFASLLAPAVLAVSCGDVRVTPPAPDGGPVDAGSDAPPDGPFHCPVDASTPIPPPWGCPVIDPHGYGTCGAALGYGFDGTACVPVDGCLPGPGTGVFSSTEACAASCPAGTCDTSKLSGALTPGMGLQPGVLCDDVEIFADSFDAPLLALLCSIYPLRCESGTDGSLHCYAMHGTLTAEQIAALCTLSKVPQVQELLCLVYL